jgi:two-component system, NtrC family, sensor kinase
MNPYAIPPLIVSVMALLLGSLVLLKNRQSRVSRLFFLEATFVSVWIFSYFRMYVASSGEEADLWAKICYASVAYIVPFFYQFTSAFIGKKEEKKIVISLHVLASILAIFAFLPNLLIDGVVLRFWGYYPKTGQLHIIFVIYCLILFGIPLISLYKYYKSAGLSVQEKNRRGYVAFAFVPIYLATTDFLPKYGVDIYPVGSIFVSIWLTFIAYAIIKYRAMDIKFVLSRGMMYVFTMLFGVVPTVIIIFFLQKVFPLAIPITLILVLAIALALLFAKIHPFSERLVQNRLFKNQLNYYQILRKFSHEMVTALDLRDLLKRFDETLRENMQVTSVAIYLTGPLNGRYPLTHPLSNSSDLFAVLRNEPKANDGAAVLHSSSMAAAHHMDIIPLWKSGDALVSLAYEAKDVLVRGEMEMMARERENRRVEEAIVQMKEAGAEVCLPLKRDGKMVGIALLGPREGDRYFSPDDLSLLHTIGQNACVAIQNALLVEEIKRSYQILQRTQRLAAMGSLISGVSHEIRNPLMPISFLMDTIDEPVADKELLARLHKYSRESLRRITTVLDEMDELSRPYTPEFNKTDVNSVVEDALSLVEVQLKLRHQKVKKELLSLPEAMVDGERMKHAVMDILLNGIEANPEGGELCVRTRVIALKKTKTHPARQGIQIEISDCGCGIPPENLERVFDPFFTTKHKSLMREGTGLGLAIAHRIVEEHHGSIEIRSTVGKGTVVYVHFPVDR